MSSYERNANQTLTKGLLAIFAHIPIFYAMAKFFGTEVSIAVGGPLVVGLVQFLVNKFSGSIKLSSALMAFNATVLSAMMIHLGKGMIEWHFHIFVVIGVLSLLADPVAIIVAAATAAVHHISFYFILPESIFNYEASIWIVAIHAAFVVVEAAACTLLAFRFKKSLDVQDKLNEQINPLVGSIEGISANSRTSCNVLLEHSDANLQAISEISSSAERVNELVNRTKDKITELLDIAHKSDDSVKSSSRSIEEGERFLVSLNEIKEQMSALQEMSSDRLGSVVDTVHQISDKTNIINDIVFQTKLLSFNASVEAARAGEHGKGFAVVAEEIGLLATNSGEASVEINKIVDESRSLLAMSVDSINTSLMEFQTKIEKAYDSWDGISSDLQKSFKNVENGTTEQRTNLEIISRESDQQSEELASLSQALHEIKLSSDETVEQIKNVEELSSRLKSDVGELHHLHNQLSDKKAA